MKKLLLISLVLNACLLIPAGYLVSKKYLSHPSTAETIAAKVERYKAFSIDGSDVVFEGDSNTENFPANELIDSVPVKIRGIAWSDTKDVLNRISYIADREPRKLFLMIGTNDFLRKTPIDTIKSNMQQIIACVKQPTALYVQSILPTNNIETNRLILTYNQWLKGFCNQKGVVFVDLYPRFLSNGVLNPAYTVDGIHLNLSGQTVWKEIVQPLVL